MAVRNVKVTGLRRAGSLLRKTIIKELRSKEMRAGIGKIVVEGIQSNRKPVTSEITLAFREFYEQFNKTDSKYRRSDINMTFTGQLMNDLMNNIRLSSTRGVYTYTISQSNRNHKGYKYKSGGGKLIKSGKNKGRQKKVRSGKTNPIAFSTLSDYLYKKGYNYLDLDEKTLTKASDFIQNRLSLKLREFLKGQ